jgi:hypothetical protein
MRRRYQPPRRGHKGSPRCARRSHAHPPPGAAGQSVVAGHETEGAGAMGGRGDTPVPPALCPPLPGASILAGRGHRRGGVRPLVLPRHSRRGRPGAPRGHGLWNPRPAPSGGRRPAPARGPPHGHPLGRRAPAARSDVGAPVRGGRRGGDPRRRGGRFAVELAGREAARALVRRAETTKPRTNLAVRPRLHVRPADLTITECTKLLPRGRAPCQRFWETLSVRLNGPGRQQGVIWSRLRYEA